MRRRPIPATVVLLLSVPFPAWAAQRQGAARIEGEVVRCAGNGLGGIALKELSRAEITGADRGCRSQRVPEGAGYTNLNQGEPS